MLWWQIMSKNVSAPLLRTARLLDLVPFLNTHQGIALNELAKHFDVSQSQMSADLTTLWMCGLPGYTPLELMDLEFESGFVSIKNAATLSKPRKISFHESVALMLGLDLIASYLPEERQDLLSATQSLRERLTKILGIPIKLSVATSTSGAVSTAIAHAVRTNGGLVIRYHSMYRDLITERTVMPVDVYQENGNDYMRAYCLTALDYREFRLDRIEQATPTTVTATHQQGKSDTEKIRFALSVMKASRDVTERFAIANIEIGETVELSSYSKQWIERSVMASGGAAHLETPLDIRAEIARKAQLVLNRYKEA
jgi:proteasome accessory factor C